MNNRNNYGNRRNLADHRIIYQEANLAAGERNVKQITSSVDFGQLETILAFQIGGNPGDIVINNFPVSTVYPTPVKISGNALSYEVLNPGPSLVLYAPIVSNCKHCGK